MLNYKILPIQYINVQTKTIRNIIIAHSSFRQTYFNIIHIAIILFLIYLALLFLSFKDGTSVITGIVILLVLTKHIFDLLTNSEIKLFGNILYPKNKNGYDFVLFKEQNNIHPKASLRQILKNREKSYVGLFFEWGNRKPPSFIYQPSIFEKFFNLQFFPIYFYRLNTEYGIGFGFWTYYIGLRYTSSVSDFSRKRISYFGQIPYLSKLFK